MSQSVAEARRGYDSIAGAFDWWCAGLSAGLAAIAQSVRPARRFRMATLSAPFALDSPGGRGTPTAIRLPDNPQLDIPAEILRETRGSIIEIVVPPAAIVERHLDPLPAESRPYVESVVEHQAEGIFPWRADDTLRTVHISDRSDGRLDVTVRATARPALAPALAAAARCGAREAIVVAGSGTGHGTIPVPLRPAATGTLAVARAAVAGLVALAAVVVGWTTYEHWSLAAEVADLDQAIAERRMALKRVADQRGATGASGLEGRKERAVIAVAVMDALSAILPDDTYLTELTLDEGRVRISGVSARATEIVPLLEGSGRFKNASFYAPTTRIAGTDRFSIEAVVVAKAVETPQ